MDIVGDISVYHYIWFVVMVILAASTYGWKKFKDLVKETSEALVTLNEAIQDDSISREELKEIKDSFGDVLESAETVTGDRDSE